ncbi:hypothetical protein UNOSLW4_0150 [Pseudomonas phage UNO-SLW4]|uniref:Uncharacterized protein n=5 Tax=Unosvirus TaxID=3424968 RepID=A0A1B2ANL6_9CAUD|nr:hypothetical protein HOS26_gp30 [Pseudomonas phage UNO-SLW1]ANY29045.1 hypothetical protein UNOSLW4_0150 [Pseudomonas phage UNO-SLW4]ANY29092.1 hypothetical protein UNOSLW3_0155 [Pseudomonas phage UNO-SLW3]ANY29138.1 hypothetical protein UNOSLW2_0150 [Pseudomonas phage UNO-SLW2]UBU95726.1 virion structural protein [Pseudomonas phage PCS4]UPW35224.1 hypothetical protein [Pseudomonas phage PCS5]UZZ63892.1 hypothetical protein PSV6_32 [Pseudomonas phage PSV6]
MCFSKKMKIPKPNTDQKAPEPVLLEAPKGVAFGDGADDEVTNDDAQSSKGIGSLKVKKADVDTGDGSRTAAPVKDTGITPSKKNGSIKRAMKR